MSEETKIPVMQLAGAKCACLRSKSAYGVFGDYAADMEEILGSTSTYWCLRTMGKAGPDEHYVHGRLCREGRSCWQNPETV
jgi:hypothetical protein